MSSKVMKSVNQYALNYGEVKMQKSSGSKSGPQFKKKSFGSREEFYNFFSRVSENSITSQILNLRPKIEYITISLSRSDTNFLPSGFSIPYVAAKKRNLKIVTKRVRDEKGFPKELVIGLLQQ